MIKNLIYTFVAFLFLSIFASELRLPTISQFANAVLGILAMAIVFIFGFKMLTGQYIRREKKKGRGRS